MTTCILIAAVIACSDVRPATPAEAIRTFAASARPSLPKVSPPLGGTSYLPPPLQQPRQSRIQPLSTQWTSVTTYVPRFGPPRTVFDGGRRRRR